ncbi:C40 family peptidase [Cellulomonas fimi]|uniref:NLP/P60 protein n=1 Tax=Cellulomonas fimi (strain ATCC 484 / DSM 20113 / JCM 1341 / CCUG 24087 / LMG 16345 / NBRC 15513 / NCIMB 8980 / NCTC 7547 / NRS-133) TaxID=590998 RepID=F4GYU7_CELFA|nr:C40 family peptidase [Cellulomonas fimi]AEE44816.1 NLP/P60 protein [Cellulomonas fimi ATCC 484]NNH08368.1 C40 family peptidase [Cellulomonas fimi]VEH27374.1 Peptidoglycan endopeptidase RipA precursor [Cellulomonas fimi]
MSLDGIASVQARMAELRSLVVPAPVASPSSASTAAVAGDAVTGTTGAADDFTTLLASLSGTSGATATTAGGGATAQSFVAAAQKYVGVPYVWGGESLDEGGLDCSGLVLRALADVGVTDVPRVARDQQRMGEPVASLAQALPGDLVVFGGGNHIGIYLGEGKMVDAPKPGAHVVVRDVYTTPTAIRRILPQQSEVTAAAGSATGTSPAGATATAASQRVALELLTSLSGGAASSSSLAVPALGVAS